MRIQLQHTRAGKGDLEMDFWACVGCRFADNISRPVSVLGANAHDFQILTTDFLNE